MTYYHAVLIGEDGMEFGAGVEAESRLMAAAKLREDYPESRIDQIESPSDTAEREARVYADALAGIDYDDDGRPFYADGGPEWDDDDFDVEDALDDLEDEPEATIHFF